MEPPSSPSPFVSTQAASAALQPPLSASSTAGLLASSGNDQDSFSYELQNHPAASTDGLASSDPSSASGRISELPPVDRGRGAWTFVVSSFLLEFFLWGYAGSFGVIQLYLSTHAPFDTSSLASIGAVGTVSLGLQLILPLFLVLLSRRYPHRVRGALWLAMGINTVAMTASSFATNVAELVVLQGVIGGLSGSVLYVPVISYLQEWFVEKRGTASGIIFAGMGMGGACLPYFISYLLETFGFAWATRIWVIISFFTVGPATYAIRPRLPVVTPAPDTPFAPVDLAFLRTKAVVPVSLVVFLAGLSWFPVSVMIPTFTASIGGSSQSSNIVLSLLNIANTIGGVIFGWFSDRVGYAWLFVFLGLGEGLAALASWGTASSLSAVMGFVVLFGLLNGQTSIWTACGRDLARANPSNAAVICSSMGVMRGISCIAGPLVAAALYDPSLKEDSSSWGRFGFKNIMIWVAGTSFASAGAALVLAVLQPTSRKAKT